MHHTVGDGTLFAQRTQLDAATVVDTVEVPTALAHLLDAVEIRAGIPDEYRQSFDPPYRTVLYIKAGKAIAWTTDSVGSLADLPAGRRRPELRPLRNMIEEFTRSVERRAFGEYLEGDTSLFHYWWRSPAALPFPAGAVEALRDLAEARSFDDPAALHAGIVLSDDGFAVHLPPSSPGTPSVLHLLRTEARSVYVSVDGRDDDTEPPGQSFAGEAVAVPGAATADAVAVAALALWDRLVGVGQVGFEHWGCDGDYPVADWQREVADGGTRLGYWDWVDNRRDVASGEEEGGG